MKTIVGRFATAEDAVHAQALLNNSYASVSHARSSVTPVVTGITAVSAVAGALVGYLSASGVVAGMGLSLNGGQNYLGVTTTDPLTLLGYAGLGLALGIVVGLILGIMAAFLLPQPGALPFRIAALAHYGQTVIVQAANGQADRIAKLLGEGRAQKVQTLDGRIDPAQVNYALDQLAH
jgi:hypothetical protein